VEAWGMQQTEEGARYFLAMKRLGTTDVYLFSNYVCAWSYLCFTHSQTSTSLTACIISFRVLYTVSHTQQVF